MIKFNFTYKDTEDHKNWVSFYPEFERGKIQLENYGYFDPRPQLNTTLTTLIALVGLCFTGASLLSLAWIPFFIYGWGKLYIKLPYDTGMGDECDSPWWGYYFYAVDGKYTIMELVTKWGKKGKYIQLPWSLQWYRTSLLLKNGTWENDGYWKGRRRRSNKEFWDSKWDDKKFVEKYPYTYTLKSGEKQDVTATITVEEREWRRKWGMYLPVFNRVDKSIKVEFSGEVGERAGSWKGGCTGCSYTMRPEETPLKTLQRMSRERKF